MIANSKGLRFPYFKFYVEDWLEGTRNLTPAERGLYIDLIALTMKHEGPIEDRDDWFSHQMHVSKRLWKSIKAQLIAKGKVLLSDGRLVNERCVSELQALLQERENRSSAAIGREEIRRNSRSTRAPTSAKSAASQCRVNTDSAATQPRVSAESKPNRPRKNSEFQKKSNEINATVTTVVTTPCHYGDIDTDKDKKDPLVDTPLGQIQCSAQPAEQAGPTQEQGFLFEGESINALNGHRVALEAILGGRLPFEEAMHRIGKNIDREAEPYAQGMQAAAAMQKLVTDLDKPKRQRGSRLPTDWRLPKKYGEWARGETSLSDDWIRKEGDKFADYWRAQPGTKALKVDWFATWKNWVRNAKKPNGPGSSYSLSGHYVGETL